MDISSGVTLFCSEGHKGKCWGEVLVFGAVLLSEELGWERGIFRAVSAKVMLSLAIISLIVFCFVYCIE